MNLKKKKNNSLTTPFIPIATPEVVEPCQMAQGSLPMAQVFLGAFSGLWRRWLVERHREGGKAFAPIQSYSFVVFPFLESQEDVCG